MIITTSVMQVVVAVSSARHVFSRDEQGSWEVWKFSFMSLQILCSLQMSSSDWLDKAHIFSILKPVFPPSYVYFSAAGGGWTFAWLDLWPKQRICTHGLGRERRKCIACQENNWGIHLDFRRGLGGGNGCGAGANDPWCSLRANTACCLWDVFALLPRPLFSTYDVAGREMERISL